MNRDEVTANVEFARAFALLDPPTSDRSMQIDLDTLVAVLEALPSYVEITLEFIERDNRRSFDLMARDIPGSGRRFTNLTHGTEWFDIAKIIAANDVEYVVATKRGEEQPMLLVSL